MKFHSFITKSFCLSLLVLAPFQTTQVTAGAADSVRAAVKWSIAGVVGAWATYRFAPCVLHGTYSVFAGDDNIVDALEGIKKNRDVVKGVREEVFALRNLLVDTIDQTHTEYSKAHNAQSVELSDAAIALNDQIFENRHGHGVTPLLDAHLKGEKYYGWTPEFILNAYQAVKRPCADWIWAFSDDKKILITHGGDELYRACKGLKKAAQNALKVSSSHKAVQQQVDLFVKNARVVIKLTKSLDKKFEVREDEIKKIAILVGTQVNGQAVQLV